MQTKKYDKLSETLITEKLPNGLTVSIVPRPGFSKSYAMFATNYGGADRRFKLGGQWIDTPAGVAHFLEHKMFDMPDGGNALNILSSNGASPNAFTGSGITAYYFESTAMFYENLELLLSFVSTPCFTPESVQKEQGIIGQEIRMVEDDPGFVVYNNLMRCLYSQNPIRDSVAGTVESIAQITDQTLNHCHRVFYNPSNMTLAVVGDVEAERVIELVKKILPAEAGALPERDYGERESETPNQREIFAAMEVSAPQFLFGAMIAPAEAGEARLKQMLTGEIALRYLMGRSSPFYTDLYAQGLLNGSFEFELDYAAGTAMLIAGGESRDVQAVMTALNSHVVKLRQEGMNTLRFESAKKSQYGGELRAFGSFSALAQGLSMGAFANYCPLDALEIIEKVTQKDVMDFILANLSENRLALSVITPNGQE